MKGLDVDSNDGSPESVAPSLLVRLRAQDGNAWQRLTHLFGPLVYSWCRREGLQPEDAADVQQEVFRAVARAIPQFRRERPGDSFRGWLWTITRNKLHDFWRQRRAQPAAAGGTSAHQHMQAVAEAESSESGCEGAPERELYRRAVELIRAEFEENTWQAFWRVTVEEQASAEVAAALGMSTGAVYVAKSRVLRRLREEMGDLLD